MTDIKPLMLSGSDLLSLVISKDEIVSGDITRVLNVLLQLTGDLEVADYFRERVDIAFDGYNDTSEELWENVDVRNFVMALDEKFPYWLYFLSKEGLGLYVIIKCFLLPHIRPEKEQMLNGPKLQEYLQNRGFPAFNYLCKITGVSEDENMKMTNRLVQYLIS